MTKRFLRHCRPKVKVAALVPLVFLFGYLSGSCLRAAWQWAVVQERLVPGTVGFSAGIAVLLLALVVAVEINVAWLRWLREQEREDAARCVIPDCDRPLGKPHVREPGLGNLCMNCVRRLARISEGLTERAREAGVV